MFEIRTLIGGVCSGAHAAARRVDGDLGQDTGGTLVAEHVNIERRPVIDHGPFQIAEREALADAMSVTARSHEADQRLAVPDGLVADGVGVLGIDLHEGEAARWRCLALAQGGVSADEVRLVEINEAVDRFMGELERKPGQPKKLAELLVEKKIQAVDENPALMPGKPI